MEAATDAGVAEALHKLTEAHPGLDRFLGSMIAVAPFLRGLTLADPERLMSLLEQAPETSFATAWSRSLQRRALKTSMS